MRYLAVLLCGCAVVCAQSSSPRVRGHRLPRLNSDETKPISKGRLKAQGIARRLPEMTGEWTTLADGRRVWLMSLSSPDASGLRVHFRGFHAGEGKVVIYRDQEARARGEVAGPYTGEGPLGDGEFWAETVPGESAIVEYEPAGTSEDVPFRIDRVLHLYPRRAQARPRIEMGLDTLRLSDGPSESVPGLQDLTLQAAGVQSKCSPDVACYAAWIPQAKAVASISFIEGGYSYSCTGSLIADPSGGALPLFLTANHCISNDAAARTVVAYFNYEASTCGGVPADFFSVPRVTGATYVVSRPISQGDFSLLRLASPAPAGTAVLQLSANADPLVGESVTGIHHPGRVDGGSQEPNSKRISFGTRQSPQGVNVEGQIMPADRSLIVNWTPGQGYTEPGSSGSPLFSRDGKLIGVLSAGAEDGFVGPCSPTVAVGFTGSSRARCPSCLPISDARCPSRASPRKHCRLRAHRSQCRCLRRARGRPRVQRLGFELLLRAHRCR